MIWLMVILIACCGHIAYLCRFQLRRWWRGCVVDRDLPPHERWPEVLHWRRGDKFEGTYDLRHTAYTLIAVQEDGYAVVQYFGDRDWAPISKLVGHNVSLRTRRVNEDLQQSNDYMELINQFKIAYAELEERDKQLKLVS